MAMAVRITPIHPTLMRIVSSGTKAPPLAARRDSSIPVSGPAPCPRFAGGSPGRCGAARFPAGLGGDARPGAGQGCFEAGTAKNTYGTGCFLLLNTGPTPVASSHQLLTTVGWHMNGQTTYCLEGSVFVAGAVVQWLRDGLGLIRSSAEIEQRYNMSRRIEAEELTLAKSASRELVARHWAREIELFNYTFSDDD